MGAEEFSRTERLLGSEAMARLKAAKVAVFGIGGVGGYVVEALVRSGIGGIAVIDNDLVCLSNINRQIIATRSTVGQYKVDAMEARIRDINPDCVVEKHRCFYLPENKEAFDLTKYTYVVDAVDTVAAKIQLAVEAQEKHVPIISSMGAGNKLCATGFEVADLYETSVCPLAKVMRRELKKRGVARLKVVYSKEQPLTPLSQTMEEENSRRRTIPGSVAFVPSIAGLTIAAEVIREIALISLGQ